MSNIPPDEESMPPTTQRPLDSSFTAYSEADDSELPVRSRSWRWVWIVCAVAGLAIVVTLILALLEVDRTDSPATPAPATSTSERPAAPHSSAQVAPSPPPTVISTVIETTVVVETPPVVPTEVAPSRPEEGRLCHELHPRRECDGYR
ncbi:MAG: hypothetical protein ACRDUS_07325 [Mycobacterium sp.]